MSVLQLGLSDQAWAVAHLVVPRIEEAMTEWDEPGLAITEFLIRPWSNGREKGLTFMRRRPGYTQALAVFQHRISDSIIVWEFKLPSHFWEDVVRPEDLEEGVADQQYRNPALEATWGNIGQAAEYIMRTLAPGEIYI